MPLLLAGCAMDTSGLLPAGGGSDARVDGSVPDALLRDGGSVDGSGPRDGGVRDATEAPDAFDECAATTVLIAQDFEAGDSLEALGWTPTVEMSPFDVRLSVRETDGPGSDDGRYLLFATSDGNTGSAESGSATSPWLDLPRCTGGTVTVSVRAVAGDIDFARDSEVFELSVVDAAANVLGPISFADQDDRNIGRPAALLGGHRLLETTDWIRYEQSWPAPAGTTEIRVSARSWITHWDDFGGIDQLVVSYVPSP